MKLVHDAESASPEPALPLDETLLSLLKEVEGASDDFVTLRRRDVFRALAHVEQLQVAASKRGVAVKNASDVPAPTGGSATESAVQSIRTMLQMERDLPSTMTGVDGIEALTESVVELAPRLTTDEALTLLGVGALLFRVTKGCPRAEDQDTTWPAGLVDHIRKTLPSLDEITAAAPGIAGPMASVPAVYVHLLLTRISHLEMAAELAETRTKAQISDLIGAFALDNPAGAA